MEGILEILFAAYIAPIFVGLFDDEEQNAVALYNDSRVHKKKRKKPVWKIVLIIAFRSLLSLALAVCLIGGIIMFFEAKATLFRSLGVVGFLVGLITTVTRLIVVLYRESEKTKKNEVAEKPHNEIIGGAVRVIIDKPLGAADADTVYEVNYGHTEDKRQAYLLGVDEPIKEYQGVVAAIIRRSQGEQILVVVPENYEISNEEIIRKTEFKEKFFRSVLIADIADKQ